MPIEVSDRFRVVGFGAWGLLYGTLLIAESPLAEQKLWVFIPSTLVSLSLVAFVFFKMAYYFPATSEASKKWHDFFYTERRGAMALLALCIIWCFDVICTLINTFEDLVSSGAIEKVLAKLNSQGIFGMIMSDGLKIFIVFYSLFLLSWIFWAGVKAFWRIRAPVHRESDHEAGLGLVSRQSD